MICVGANDYRNGIYSLRERHLFPAGTFSIPCKVLFGLVIDDIRINERGYSDQRSNQLIAFQNQSMELQK